MILCIFFFFYNCSKVQRLSWKVGWGIETGTARENSAVDWKTQEHSGCHEKDGIYKNSTLEKRKGKI